MKLRDYRVLRALAELGSHVTATEIARKTGLQATQVGRILHSYRDSLMIEEPCITPAKYTLRNPKAILTRAWKHGELSEQD